MAKNLVLLFDGTGNQPNLHRETNVLRLFNMMERSERQVVWYDPGIGTEGSAKAVTALGRKLTKIAGLAFGYGLKHNVTLGYRFLMENYEPGDRIFLLGFSRGAYTARALAGFLYQLGLLRKGHHNLIPYAFKLFWWHHTKKVKDETWEEADHFSNQFAREDFKRRLDGQVHHVAVWDTVNATGILRGRLVLPWTVHMPMAASMSHAVSIDEKRRPFRPTLLASDAAGFAGGDFREVWFAGVHSDVGGTFMPDHQLADIALGWNVAEAIERGLIVDEEAFGAFRLQPASKADGEIHNMGWKWWVATLFFHRKIPDDAVIHESVQVRMDNPAMRYTPRLPADFSWEAWKHRA